MKTQNSALRNLMTEAGIGENTIEFVEQGLRDEDLVVVKVSQAFLVIGWRNPFRRRPRNVAPS